MGYYIQSTDAHWTIPADKVDDAYRAVVELNKKHHLKRGGSSFPLPKPEGSTSVSDRPDKWFSWMGWNYDETCETLSEVFEELGFYGSFENPDDGFFLGEEYDSKTGNEYLFLEAIAPFSTENSYINFTGEDGEMWRYIVKDGKLLYQAGSITYN